MISADTSREAEDVLVELYRQMPVSRKIARIFEAYTMGKMLTKANLRQIYPEADENRIWRLWAKQHLGEQLYESAYGGQIDE